jgi:sugar (pentulose or hexulose) kinase
MVKSSAFSKKSLDDFDSYEDAYHHLIHALILQQVQSTKIVLSGSPVKKIFVDGGFGKNPIYMNLLAKAFPGIKVYAATVAQASSFGAALAIHKSWNKAAIPADIIGLKFTIQPMKLLLNPRMP